MKVSELRIEVSKVNFRYENGTYTVTDIGRMFNDEPYSVEIMDSNGMFVSVGIEDLEPIPLTEDVLVKCGFEKAGNHYYKKSIGEYLELAWHFLSDNSICLQTKGSGSKERTHVVHLHQLQNLYFALAGKELNVEL